LQSHCATPFDPSAQGSVLCGSRPLQSLAELHEFESLADPPLDVVPPLLSQ
jgi:hypothetical protein